MTVHSQVSTFIPHDYQIFAGLGVDKHSIAVTCCNHEGLLQALRLPYSAARLLNYVRKHFGEQRLQSLFGNPRRRLLQRRQKPSENC